MAQPRARAHTQGFAGYSLAFSPFHPNQLAVAGSANFGLVGNGRLSILGVTPAGLGVDKVFDTQDGLYDLAFSEVHEHHIATASGDGSVKLWDVMLNDFPIRKWHEHTREVFSIDWSNTQKELFCTSSWDCSIKVWTPDRPTSILTIPAHTACVYAAIYSPTQPHTIASCSTDGYLKVWDTRTPLSPAAADGRGQATPQLSIAAHPTEVLSLDWNKYESHLIATGSVDKTIRIHDLRMVRPAPQAPGAAPLPPPLATAGNSTIATLLGHEYAVRKVAWSPHSANLLASASYDMTARVWSVDAVGRAPGAVAAGGVSSFGPGGMGARVVASHGNHSEFVTGVGWSLYEQGTIASCSWDQMVDLWAI